MKEAAASDHLPIVNREYLLEKLPGKGGWTYARIPEVKQSKHSPFGWVQVSGAIDQYVFEKLKLMPMGNGQLFLPVKAAIRKFIGKRAGDVVKIRLYLDHTALTIPNEILACFQQEPESIYQTFKSFADSEKKAYLDWIFSAKTDDTRIRRIVAMMERLQLNLRLHEDIPAPD